MSQAKIGQNSDQTEASINVDPLTNILRILSMLEKALNRVARNNYFSRAQYPEIFFEIEASLNTLRSWIEKYKVFCASPTFNSMLGMCLENLAQLIGQLIVTCSPVRGKKRIKKTRLIRQQERLFRSIAKMLESTEAYLSKLKSEETSMGIEFERALFKAFELHCRETYEKESRERISRRGEKTYVFPCSDKDDYKVLVNDRKRFRAEVVDKLNEYGHATGHKPTCNGERNYHLTGFRSSPRKVVLEGGKKEEFAIRMVQCTNCEEKFSLLPSFLPREKHFGIDIIGNLVKGVFLFAQSLNAALENSKLTGRGVKSKQTILNWIRWIGTLHPATILTRAGVKGSGYLQEDEGFEKEPNLRTYTVTMVDAQTLLVWHMDYVDRVDEAALCGSFEKFVETIDFKILGVTKDKWLPSTNALKKVFHSLWIGFCHLHCLKKFRKSLSEYQKEVKCSAKESRRIYKKFKKILETATSKASLQAQIKLLNEPAFNHPLLTGVLDEVKKNAVRYTSHKNRKGITKTTSLADNFLKTVKRKLRQVESFRDQDCSLASFRAMANVRNFAPFMSGAKNAHQSPFMLAQGQTYNLPWIQVMNVHNAFLFTENAC